LKHDCSSLVSSLTSLFEDDFAHYIDSFKHHRNNLKLKRGLRQRHLCRISLFLFLHIYKLHSCVLKQNEKGQTKIPAPTTCFLHFDGIQRSALPTSTLTV
jgi:hypothetical protein